VNQPWYFTGLHMAARFQLRVQELVIDRNLKPTACRRRQGDGRYLWLKLIEQFRC
jgi:hypothetical protein